jgi:putative oxidoreductase
LIIGAIFIVHGYTKLFGGPGKPVSPLAQRFLGVGFTQQVQQGSLAGVSHSFEHLGMPSPRLMALLAGGVEFVGGILLVLGLLTRPAALLLAGEMVVAIQKVHWRNGLLGPGGFEYPLALMASAVGLLGSGAGDFSLDSLICQLAPGDAKARSEANLVLLIPGLLGLVAALFRSQRKTTEPASRLEAPPERMAA